MTFAVTATVVGVVGIGAGLYESSQQQAISSQALGLAQNTQGEQMQAYQQLQQLIANPNSFFQSGVYQSAFNQGSAAVQRQQSAAGFNGSTNDSAALQAYGQSFGQQQLLEQEQLLASMSGTTSASSPASALGAASGASSASFGQLGTLLAALGQTGALGAGIFGGSNPGFTPGGGGSPGMGVDFTAQGGPLASWTGAGGLAPGSF